MKIPTFTKTIRFRLTLWYAALLLLFVILFIIGLNLTMDRFGPVGPFPHSPNIVRQIRIENQELLRNYSLIGLAGLIVFGAAGGYFLSRRMLKPVDRVSSLAARISSTNLKERINYQGPDDEMKRLADTFDDMLERLEGAFETQKQFIQDASHELRTPIAIAQTNIEVAEMDGKATARDYKRLMEVLKMSLERMNRLSDNLLLLSEGDQSQIKWSVVDMAALLNEVAAEAGAKATAAGVGLELEPILEETLVMGDALRLKQALINLVDNAIKYNRTGGTVKLSARAEGSQVVLQVQDSGIGISAADQQRIFDRFYRVDKSRSRAQGGSGLGLAIVKKIVENHGGTISLESTPGEGSIFRMYLPRHSPA
ncbi:Signal transduction histidine-protein kinase ArlS [subsurface metagenome]